VTTDDAPAPALLALTMGDACGIGPEIIVRALADGAAGPCVVVGDLAVMRRAARHCGLMLPIALLDEPEDALDLPPRCLGVWQPPAAPDDDLPGSAAMASSSDLAELAIGTIQAKAGLAAARCIAAAAGLALHRRVAAVVTAPIHKEALAAAGIAHPGHTEMLAALSAQPGAAAPEVRMMLTNGELSVVLVTIHVSLREAITLISLERVLQTIRIADRAARAWGLAAPRIAVAGLNPHAGEGGLFGSEETAVIAPAVAAARAEGIQASGPYAPDTVFMRARNAPGHPGEFDLVVAMTHDHGLIPVKYLGVELGVNVTLGLPFVRTSPDHGTAFDIAGTGRADPSSLRAAIAMARRLSRRG
jgi:4-hydroxythreonine-4-phosphate dehydrogenase